jgi:hypothetical protein
LLLVTCAEKLLLQSYNPVFAQQRAQIPEVSTAKLGFNYSTQTFAHGPSRPHFVKTSSKSFHGALGLLDKSVSQHFQEVFAAWHNHHDEAIRGVACAR